MNAEVILLLTGAPFLAGCVPLLAPLSFYVIGEAALERERKRRDRIEEQLERLKSEIAAMRAVRLEQMKREQKALASPFDQELTRLRTRDLPLATRSGLEHAQADGLAWFEEVGQALNAWAAAAGNIDPELFREQRDALSRLRQRLIGSASMEELANNRHATTEAVVRLLTALISKTDRDLDPERTNGALQKALTNVVQAVGFSMTGSIGEEVDSGRHKLTGAAGTSGSARRGTVAAVRTRGLMNANGEVYALAEIVAFD